MFIKIIEIGKSALDVFEEFLQDIIDMFSKQTLKKEWQVEKLSMTPPCAECLELDGTVVDFNDNFPLPSNDKGPPLHPNCRCKLNYKRT
jgi:hypothetical protein